MTSLPAPHARQLGLGEFATLMALLTSLVALSIDAMLPALPLIGSELGAPHANDNQLVITFLFLGLTIGQFIYGPISDTTGRKAPLYAGLFLFLVGCLVAIFAQDFNTMLVGRFLQGLGVAGPRILTIALIRDLYEGREMARVISIVKAIFITVPVVAPAMGQGILAVAEWRAIFAALFLVAVVASIWFLLRQPETVPVERRRPFSLRRVWRGVRETCGNRIAFGYTLAAGLVFGAFIGYLVSAQQILQQQYALGSQFAFYFAILSLSLGASALCNAKLVMRYGMVFLSKWSLLLLSGISILFFFIAQAWDGNPPLSWFIAWCLLAFFCLGPLFGNFYAMAMEPLGRIAGVAAAVIGSLTSFISLVCGTVIGQSYDGTILPLVAGFAALGIASLLTLFWTGRQASESDSKLSV